jgi:hypothetical protein
MPVTSTPSHINAISFSVLSSISSLRTPISADDSRRREAPRTPQESGRVVDQGTRPCPLARLDRLT